MVDNIILGLAVKDNLSYVIPFELHPSGAWTIQSINENQEFIKKSLDKLRESNSELHKETPLTVSVYVAKSYFRIYKNSKHSDLFHIATTGEYSEEDILRDNEIQQLIGDNVAFRLEPMVSDIIEEIGPYKVSRYSKWWYLRIIDQSHIGNENISLDLK